MLHSERRGQQGYQSCEPAFHDTVIFHEQQFARAMYLWLSAWVVTYCICTAVACKSPSTQ